LFHTIGTLLSPTFIVSVLACDRYSSKSKMISRLLDLIERSIIQPIQPLWIELTISINESIFNYLKAAYECVSNQKLFKSTSKEEKPIWTRLMEISAIYLKSSMFGLNSYSVQKARYYIQTFPQFRLDFILFVRKMINFFNHFRNYINSPISFPSKFIQELVNCCIEGNPALRPLMFDLIAISMKQEFMHTKSITVIENIVYSQIHDCFCRERRLFNGLILEEIFIVHELTNLFKHDNNSTS
jgi:hypothetical protein